MEKEHLPFIIIAGLAALVYSYSAPILSALELWGNMFWFAITLSIPLGFCLVVGAIGFKFWEAVTEVSHRRGLELMSADTKYFEAQKKTPLVAGQPRQLSTPSTKALPAPVELPKLLDLIPKMERAVIVGGTGAGKSELMKWVISGWQKTGCQISIVDPHSPNQILGINCIGHGYDLEAIVDFMYAKMAKVKQQYRTGNISQNGDLGLQNQYTYIDEFPAVMAKHPDVCEQFINAVLTDFRKAGERIFFNAQSERATAIGGKGSRDKWDDVYKIKVSYDEALHAVRDCYVGKFSTLKADRIAVELPPQFPANYATIPDNQMVVKTERYNKRERAVISEFVKSDAETSQNELIKRTKYSKDKALNDFARRLLDGVD